MGDTAADIKPVRRAQQWPWRIDKTSMRKLGVDEVARQTAVGPDVQHTDRWFLKVGPPGLPRLRAIIRWRIPINILLGAAVVAVIVVNPHWPQLFIDLLLLAAAGWVVADIGYRRKRRQLVVNTDLHAALKEVAEAGPMGDGFQEHLEEAHRALWAAGNPRLDDDREGPEVGRYAVEAVQQLAAPTGRRT